MFKIGDDFPFLRTVVDNWDVLNDATTSRNSEFKLSFNLLRNCSEFILIQSDVSSVSGLENDITCVAGWLSWVTVELKDVLVRIKLST